MSALHIATIEDDFNDTIRVSAEGERVSLLCEEYGQLTMFDLTTERANELIEALQSAVLAVKSRIALREFNEREGVNASV